MSVRCRALQWVMLRHGALDQRCMAVPSHSIHGSPCGPCGARSGHLRPVPDHLQSLVENGYASIVQRDDVPVCRRELDGEEPDRPAAAGAGEALAEGSAEDVDDGALSVCAATTLATCLTENAPRPTRVAHGLTCRSGPMA
jgi:hypothetical protein